MTEQRKPWVRCIRSGIKGDKRTLCGKVTGCQYFLRVIKTCIEDEETT